MKHKPFAAAILAAVLLLSLSACGGTQSPASSDKPSSATQQTEQQNNTETSATDNSPTYGEETAADRAWKTKFEQSLFENYGVVPESYEDLGNGIYQVYVEVDGKVIPFVTVDSATGDYHG